MSSSMYANYIRERTNDEIIETSKGFATYRYINENQVYLIDIYVKSEFRKQNIATKLADIVAYKAKKRGCTEMIGSIQVSAKNSDSSIKVLLAYGMKPYSTVQDGILFKKELK